MKFEMTYRQALEAQASQIEHYSKFVPGEANKLKAVMRKATRPAPPEGVDTPLPISEINQLVPRGGFIENVVLELSKGKVRFGTDD